jgi:RHS repeat-associated protein
MNGDGSDEGRQCRRSKSRRVSKSKTLPAYEANDQLTTDNYDANGNTTSSGGVTNAYDFENRMTTSGSTTMVPQARDGDGNRVSETVGGATTKYLVDTLNPTRLPQVLDETVNGVVSRTYAYGLQRISENQQNGSTWTASFYGYDGHGNVRFLTNSAGTVTDTYQYDAFGRLIASTGSTPNNFLYSGEWFDSNVGLYYLRARYLNQATGRFWTRDPVEGVQCCGLSWNPYIYVKDNAVNAIDPVGRQGIFEYMQELGESAQTIREFRLLEWATKVEFCVDAKLTQWLVEWGGLGSIPRRAGGCVLRTHRVHSREPGVAGQRLRSGR